MKALARQLRRHWDDILAYFDHRRTNAVLEGLNSIIQNVKTRAVFCQIFVGRFGVSFSPFERLFLGRFGFGQSCGLSVIA